MPTLDLEHIPAGGLTLEGPNPTLDLPGSPLRFYRHGWQSWSHTAWIDPAQPPCPIGTEAMRVQNDDPVHAFASRHGGSGLGAVEMPGGMIVLLGALALEARVELDGTRLQGSCGDEAGRWFAACGTEQAVFRQYADHLAERFGHGRAAPAPRVWSSWYSMYYFVNQAVMHAAVEGLGDLPFDVIQVDDGWEQAWGDWEANDKFPDGMAALAARIRQSGRTAGLWLAPFVASGRSALFRDHPDWFMQGESGPVCAGENIAGPFFALDTTRAEVIDWLIALIRKARRWGYDYLKLDFLYAASLPGSRQTAQGRETSYRQALALLRQEAGDAYLLACGAPVIPSLGLCDGLRVGPDVAPYWINTPYTQGNSNLTAPGAQNALRTSLHRLWLKPLLHVDPDAVYFRTHPMRLNAAQRRLLQDLAQLCGFKSTSDLPAWLRADEREQLRQFLLAAPAVEQTGRYQFCLAERQVDFSGAIAQPSLGSRLPLGLVMQLGLLQDALQVGLPAVLAARQARRQEQRK